MQQPKDLPNGELNVLPMRIEEPRVPAKEERRVHVEEPLVVDVRAALDEAEKARDGLDEPRVVVQGDELELAVDVDDVGEDGGVPGGGEEAAGEGADAPTETVELVSWQRRAGDLEGGASDQPLQRRKAVWRPTNLS